MISISKDELWKGAIEDFIIPFLYFFFPTHAYEIDWSREIQFLDTELSRIVIGLKKGKRTADKLVKVFLKDGDEKWFLIHVEVQSQEDKNLQHRMFTMYYRIRDKYNVDVTALAILAYNGAKETGLYKHSFWGTEFTFKFNTYNIIEQVEKGLIDNTNLFSLVIKSVYTDLSYGENESEKYNRKIKILENFLKRKPTQKEYQRMMNFILMFVRLNNNFNQEIDKFVIKKANSKNMGISELIKTAYEKEVKKRDTIIARTEQDLLKKDEALLKKDEALLKKDEDLLKKDEALLKKDEETVCRSYKNGIDIPMIANITNLSKKEVKAILKKALLI